jgi:formate dehydrogenase subunit gamma
VAGFLAVLVLAVFAATAALVAETGRGMAQSNTGLTNTRGGESVSDMWRQIRRGAQGQVSIPDKRAGVMIQSEGEQWRAIRNGPLSTYGAWILTAVVFAAFAYFVVRGRIRIKAGRSGKWIPRFTLAQRIAHWFVAVLFVLLGLSGLILLYGRYVLTPIIGPEAFAAVASAALQGHNLFGPLFVPALIVMIVSLARGNGYRWVDVMWALKLGGFFGGHASAGRYNFGEKTWFWWSAVVGIVLSVTGVMLDFPWAVGEVRLLQLANLAHGTAAVLFIAGGLGHIYLATIGMEGALEGMVTGAVDANWAKEHHDLWHAEQASAPAVGPAEAVAKEARASSAGVSA